MKIAFALALLIFSTAFVASAGEITLPDYENEARIIGGAVCGEGSQGILKLLTLDIFLFPVSMLSYLFFWCFFSLILGRRLLYFLSGLE